VPTTKGDFFDVIVVGAGVVGCAVFRALAVGGARVLLVERGADILSGASKANSALLHTGYDAPADSLELSCVRAGYAEYLEIRERLNLPLVETSAILVAWNDAQRDRLPAIVTAARANGVADVAVIDEAEIRRREPHLGPGIMGGVSIPGEHVIDPWSAPLAYVRQGLAHGGEVIRHCRIDGGEFDGAAWTLNTTKGPIRGAVIINCAGLFGDVIEAIHRPSPFHIRPRKGQFVVLDKPAAQLVNAIILPVPDERTKGVLLARTAFGNLLVGPTAEEQEDREDTSTDGDVLRRLIEQGERMVPGLAAHAITATYAGLRPATEFKDYQIEASAERNWITVGGIRSTGLTGALGIAAYVRDLFQGHFGGLSDDPPRHWPTVPNLCQSEPRPYQEPDRGELVCQCELVTRKEIDAALTSALPAEDLGGLKRRTRAMMGRCQGFYCSARVAELADGRFTVPLARKVAS
jgi:glycerol-3-phosphate dehydrogenase